MNTRGTRSGGTGGADAGGGPRRSSAGRAVDKTPERTPEPREIVARRRRRRRFLALALVLVVLAATAAIVWSVVEDAREARGDAEPRLQVAAEGAAESRSDEDAPERVQRRVRPRAVARVAPSVAALVPEGSSEVDAAVPEVSSATAPPAVAGAARARATTPSAPRAVKHPDGGAPAANEPDGGAKRAANARRPSGQEPSQSDEERGLQQVDRFVATGGATLEGRVVEADGDKPVAGTSVHVHHAGMFVGAHTDASGVFRIPGILPGSRVVVWVGRNDDALVDERIAVSVPEEGQVAGQVVDVGTVKLLRGDELSSRLGGWVGVFVTRRSGQIVASAVSPWLPADQAGLEVGDQILAIDGRDTTGLGPRAVTFLLRGPAGTSVTVLVRTLGHDKRKLVLDRVVR